MKTALITGASRGIGKAISEHLVLNDYHVIMASRSIEKLEKAREEILSSIEEKNRGKGEKGGKGGKGEKSHFI